METDTDKGRDKAVGYSCIADEYKPKVQSPPPPIYYDDDIVDKQDSSGGIRYNDGKPRFSLIPMVPLTLLARLYEFGAIKYGERNWEKGLSWSETLDSAMRHMVAFAAGEDDDPETNLPHVIHAAFNMFALAEFISRHTGSDDRRSYKVFRDKELEFKDVGNYMKYPSTKEAR